MRSQRFPWRFVFYGAVLLYLVGDLLLFDGPIRRKYDHRQSVLETKNSFENGEWVATINREPITTAQLDLATRIALYREGKTRGDVSDVAYRIKRRATLQDLVNDTLVRQYAAGDGWRASAEEIEQRKAIFRSQFPPDAEIDAIDGRQELSASERDELLTRLAHQEAWIENKIAPRLESITEDSVREVYESADVEAFVNPARAYVRHLFLSTVEFPDREAEIQAISAQLRAGESFEKLVAAHSDDERTKLRGGDLGWLADRGVLEALKAPIATLPIGELSEPIRSTLGWHLIEVIARRPAEKLPFDAVKEEIHATLLNEARAAAVQELIIRYRSVAIMRVYPPNL